MTSSEADVLISDLSTGKAGIHGRISAYLRVFKEPLKTRSQKQSLITDYYPFLNRALTLLPRKLGHRSKLNEKFAAEWFAVYRLCVGCIVVISGILMKPLLLLDEGFKILRCFARWRVRDQLAVAGVCMSDEDVKALILAGLPSEYGHTRQIIRAKNNIDLEEVRCLLLSAEFEIELEHKALPLSPSAAMIAQNGISGGNLSLPCPQGMQSAPYNCSIAIGSYPNAYNASIMPNCVTQLSAYNASPSNAISQIGYVSSLSTMTTPGFMSSSTNGHQPGFNGNAMMHGGNCFPNSGLILNNAASPTYMMNNASASNASGFLSSQFSQQNSCFAQRAQNGGSVQLPYDGYGNGGLQHNGAFNRRGFQQGASVQQKHNFQPNSGLMQQHDPSHQNSNFSPHVSYTNSENYSKQSYSDNNDKNNNSRPHISNNKSYNTDQSYSGSVVCQICEKPGTFMQQNVNCVGMQVLYGGSQVQGYSQISVTRQDDNGSNSQSETNIENTQNVSQDEYVSTSEEKQEEVVSKEVSKEKVESESENGDEGNQLEKFVEESSGEKDTLPFELCLPDEDSLITVVDYKDMVERNQVKADGVSLIAAVDSSSKPMETKIGIKDARSSQVYKSEAINGVSDESSSSSLSNGMYKPHKANDVRWEAIQAVRDHDRMLGLNHFKLLNRHLMNCTNFWQSLPLIPPG